MPVDRSTGIRIVLIEPGDLPGSFGLNDDWPVQFGLIWRLTWS
jgi:hypothetical protein